MGGNPLSAVAIVAAASMLVSCAGGSDADEGVHLTGNIVRAIAVIEVLVPREPPVGTTVVLVEFTEHGSLTIPAAGRCAAIPSVVNPESKDVLAGTVDLFDGIEPIALKPSGSSYSFKDEARPAWSPGATLKLEVGGSADVPAFSASVEAPGPLLVKSPVASSGKPVGAPRDKDLELTWEPFSNGLAFFGLFGRDERDGHALEVDCLFDGRDGAGSLPAALLARYASGTATLTTDSANITTSREESWSVALLAGELGTTTAGVVGGVQLELR